MHDIAGFTEHIDVLVVAAGFEERASKVIAEARLPPSAHCILIKYGKSAINPEHQFRAFVQEARRCLPEAQVHTVTIQGSDVDAFASALSDQVARLPRELRSFAIDISGMPSYLVCTVLRVVRAHRSRERQHVLYTSALEYNPTLEEYNALAKTSGEEIELIPRALALEMSDNLVPESFAGYRSQGGKTCLALFAGYEVHRAAGVLDAVNPSLLLLLYGKPGNPDLSWRLDLSRRLHKKFERSRRTSAEVVSTLEVSEAIGVLESYYNYLIDDYDLVLAPVSSKMHSVAAYLFWERYGEVQLIFPIPIGYDPSNCPQGASTTYHLVLNARRILFKAEAEVGV